MTKGGSFGQRPQAAAFDSRFRFPVPGSRYLTNSISR